MNASLYKQHVKQKWRITCKTLEVMGYDHLLIPAGSLLYPFRDDLNYPYRTNPYFKEWLHLNDRPGSLLLISSDKQRPILFLKEEIDFWDTAPDKLTDNINENFELQFFKTTEQLITQLKKLKNNAFIGETTVGELTTAFEDIKPDTNPEPLLNRLDYARANKTAYEHQCLREATTIAAKGHKAAKQAFIAGKSEYEIHIDYLQAINCVDAELPYGNIIGLNENAATLHHMKLARNKPAKHLSMLIDAGADFNGYAADITRTYTQNSNSLFASLIHGVTRLQQQIISEIKPGINYADLHIQTHGLIIELLSELQIIKRPTDDETSLAISKTFFPHGLGHLLGIQVHDRGGRLDDTTFEPTEPNSQHPFLRCTRTIETNMVFTIEPGIYFIPSLLEKLKAKHPKLVNWELVEQLTPYGGIRIEDNIIVHKNDTENVTSNIFGSN